MSRAFVKEGAPEAPVVVPPRPPLPAGVPNYVTPAGLAALRAEKASLETQRTRLDTDAEGGGQRERELVVGKLKGLIERIALARVVDSSGQSREDVRFGATVTVRRADGAEQRFQIVGVDEAFARADAVAFTAPIARAVNGARAGETVLLKTPRGEERLEVRAVTYG